MRKVAVGALVAGGLLAMVASSAEAQIATRGRARFGQVSLRSGFMPDPHVVSGTNGGPIQASMVESGCRGYITREASHVLRSRSGFRQIRFVVNADRDSTLLVRLPNGQILCDDDGGEGLNPLIATSSPPGEIRVWVGSYSSSSSGSPYQLGITELSHVSASNLAGGGGGSPPRGRAGGGFNPNLPPAHGNVSLRSGFVPDPHIVSGMAGGPVSASQVNGGCRGHITPQPSHVLTSSTGFRSIRFVVHAGVDTTLTVMLPNGQVLCDDDGGEGLNPLIATSSPAGQIRIWVGTYSSTSSGPYNLGISELSHVGTNNVPSPGRSTPTPRPNVQVQPPADVVEMMADIPVTLMGPGMTGNTVAMWNPRGGPPTRIRLQGRSLMAGGVTLGVVPPTFQDPVITVTQRRNGSLVARAEQPPNGRGDRGQQLLMLVRWSGRPVVAERWSGTSVQRGPRWSR